MYPLDRDFSRLGRWHVCGCTVVFRRPFPLGWVGWLHPNATLLLLSFRVKRALDLFLRLFLWLFSRVSGTHAWLRFDGG